MLAFVAIFMSCVSGLIIKEKICKNSNLFESIKLYFVLVVLSNIISSLLFRIIYGHLYTSDLVSSLNYNISFFIKYCLSNILFSAGCVFAFVLFNKVVKIKLVEEKNEKK